MEEINNKYKQLCETPSDINEHLETLSFYASKSNSIAELGVRGFVSTYALLDGLLKNNSEIKKIDCYDILPLEIPDNLNRCCFETNIDLTTHFAVSDLDVDITDKVYDMIFIDTFHCYPHCYLELKKFEKRTNKFIILHDTEIDSETSECVRLGYEEQHYTTLINQYNGLGFTADDFKKGLKYALDRFLKENIQWKIWSQAKNNNGLTILKYVDFSDF